MKLVFYYENKKNRNINKKVSVKQITLESVEFRRRNFSLQTKSDFIARQIAETI